ncbi:MAG: thiamine biosynthesis protein ThiF [Anaerotignum sp.]|nr:thiamine biosynthesis protein ThiF [Anaerotignum sp.]
MSCIPSKEEMQRTLEARHGKELQAKFTGSTVAICGLGGLGSNIAVSLARAGIGRLILIDFDQVDISNLHRQQYRANQIGYCKTDALKENLQEISPYLDIVTHTVRVEENNLTELLQDADIICEAFDDAEAKAMLVNGVLEKLHMKYLIAASGMAGLGSANSIKTRRVMERFYLCGDGVSDVADDIGLVAPRVMLCAAHQAQMVLRILSGNHEP